VESPFTFIVDDFPYFPGSVICRGKKSASCHWLMYSVKWHTATNSFKFNGKLIPASTEYRQANFHYQLIGLPMSVICSGHIEMDKPNILA
jgi:hypothetical protein